MAFNLLKHKWRKITAAVLVIFILLILVMALVVNRYWSPILARKVKEVVLKSSDSLYNVSFSAAELHVLPGTLEIYNFTLKADTAIYNRLKKKHIAPNNLIELRIKRLTLSHMHPFRLYFKNKLEIGEIVLKEPVLNVSYELNHVKDSIIKDKRTFWQKMSKNIRSIQIEKILLGDVKFKYEDYSGNKVAISELKEMNISAFDLLIDSSTQNDKKRLLYCKDIIAQLNNYTGKTSSGLYTYKINSLELSTLKSHLNINGLTLKPVTEGFFFAKSKRDRFTLRIDSIQLNNFDFLNYHKYRVLSATRLIINGGAVQIYSNPNKHDDGTDQIKTFPIVALNKINSDMKIDTVIVKNINVLYNEFNKKSDQTGSVIFNKTSGKILNVTTNKAAVLKNSICNIQLTCYFMNRGKLNVSIDFNLADKENSFNYKGSLGPMDLKFVNPAAIPLGLVKITSGTLTQFDFDIHANSTADWGKVELLYNNLAVNVLKPDTVFDNLKRRPIATVFANMFFVKHNNPDIPGGKPRFVYVNYTRDKETPFFKSIWQTLFNGIKPCAGLDKKTQETIVAMTNQQLIIKQNHKIKKEQRIERREERRQKREERKLEKASLNPGN